MSDTVAALLRHKGNHVWSAGPDDSVLQAIALMADKGVGALVVLQGEAVVGMISERDYARKVVLQGRSSKDTLVRDIMTSPVLSVSPGHTIDECMRMVTAERIRHLPVVDNGKIVGMVSIGDLVRRVVSIQGETIQYLHEYIAGPHAAHRVSLKP
jgi:CBS domain-containing protein